MMKFLDYCEAFQKELKQWAGQRKLILARFFFWNSGDRMQMSLEVFYRSLLFEILKQVPTLIPVILPDLWAEAHRMDPREENTTRVLPLSYLKDKMQTLIQTHIPDCSLFLMVDGLDEYEGDTLENFELARMLKQWSTIPQTKIICSSRPHTEFVDTFDQQDRVIHLHELTRGDIRCYAQAQFEPRIHPEIYEETQTSLDEIVEQIVDMADGVFLWA
jgi:hypothetical protein